VHFTPAVYSTMNSNQFTGTGSQTDFILTQAVDEDKSFVFIQGVYQEKSTYSISGTTLTFSVAPQNGYTIEVITIGEISVTASSKYNVSVISSNTTANSNTVYVFTASLELTLPAATIGDSIKISNRSGTSTCTLVPNGANKIMGSNTTMTLDTANASFEIVFSGSAEGWVIIGQ
jgi:hypothetical protein